MSRTITIEIKLDDGMNEHDAESARVHISNIVHQAAGLLGLPGTPSVTGSRVSEHEPADGYDFKF